MADNNLKPDQNIPLHIAKQIETTNYPILISEWQNLKRLIFKIECNKDHLQKVGFLLIGTSISSFLTSIKVDDAPAKNVIYVIALAALILGFFLIYFDSKLARTTVYTRRIVLDQMDVIESKFERVIYTPENVKAGRHSWQFWRRG